LPVVQRLLLPRLPQPLPRLRLPVLVRRVRVVVVRLAGQAGTLSLLQHLNGSNHIAEGGG
jgi:hypothetical protein